jgi:hypothetical protein
MQKHIARRFVIDSTRSLYRHFAFDQLSVGDPTGDAKASWCGWRAMQREDRHATAREAQLLFDSLEAKLKGGVPAAELNSNVYSLLEELREDVAGELK